MDDFRKLTTKEKALVINLDRSIYGSFAEIGAGQEVASNFFKAGGASGTIAQTISAYDMKISDSRYGEAGRYVCEPRLHTMLETEFDQLTEKLGERKADSKFFAFADTVEALNYFKTNRGHGWIGVRFQLSPESEPNECVIHVVLKDNDAVLQQHAIGILGVNLIYACFHEHENPERLLNTLMNDLTPDRVEIDMFRLTGPNFEHVDNRLMSLKLVKNGMTDAALFGPDGEVLQSSQSLYKKNIMVLRGRFRPVTYVNMDMLSKGLDQFVEEEDVKSDNVEVLFELTLKDLSLRGEISDKDFLDRVDILCSLGHKVMISNYQKYYKLVEYLARFSKKKKIGVILGMNNLEKIFTDEDQYYRLEGGLLESFGILFGRNVKLYVYPAKVEGLDTLYTCENFRVEDRLKHLFIYLLENNKIQDIKGVNTDLLHIISDQVLAMIQDGTPGWKKMVPPKVSEYIINNQLFNYQPVKESPKVIEH